MEAILVALIVAFSVGYLVRRFYRGFKTDSDDTCACGGGCSGCDLAGTCGSMDLNRQD